MLGRYGDGLGDAAYLHLDVDLELLAERQGHARAHRFLEAGQFDRDAVAPGQEQRGFIISGAVEPGGWWYQRRDSRSGPRRPRPRHLSDRIRSRKYCPAYPERKGGTGRTRASKAETRRRMTTPLTWLKFQQRACSMLSPRIMVSRAKSSDFPGVLK